MWTTSYVRKSGQCWKLVIAAVLLFSGGILVAIMASGRGNNLEPGTFTTVLLAGVQHPVPVVRTETLLACPIGKAASRQHRMVLARGQLPRLRSHAMTRGAIGRLTSDWSGRRMYVRAKSNPRAAAAQSERSVN